MVAEAAQVRDVVVAQVRDAAAKVLARVAHAAKVRHSPVGLNALTTGNPAIQALDDQIAAKNPAAVVQTANVAGHVRTLKKVTYGIS